jgi:leader peptidase (prepilin peptidase) / N-methyltransferase
MPLTSTAVVSAAAVLGVLAGCFLPLPIYQLSTDRTGGARPAAPSASRCTHPNLAGTAGWLRLGSTCPCCHQRLGPATAATTIASGAVYAVLTFRFLHSPLLPALLVSGLLAVAATFVDLRCRRLPDGIVLPAAAACAVTIVALEPVEEPGQAARIGGGGWAVRRWRARRRVMMMTMDHWTIAAWWAGRRS